jgi:serine/threonine protein kinase
MISHTSSPSDFTADIVQVVAATSKETGRRVALKVVFLDNPSLKKEHADVLRAEVNIMQKLRHTNIVCLDNVIHDHVRKQLVIAEEILLGGTLTDELLHGTNCNNDRLVAHIFKQVRPSGHLNTVASAWEWYLTVFVCSQISSSHNVKTLG